MQRKMNWWYSISVSWMASKFFNWPLYVNLLLGHIRKAFTANVCLLASLPHKEKKRPNHEIHDIYTEAHGILHPTFPLPVGDTLNGDLWKTGPGVLHQVYNVKDSSLDQMFNFINLSFSGCCFFLKLIY